MKRSDVRCVRPPAVAVSSTNLQSNEKLISLVDREALLDVAQLSIQQGLRTGRPLEIDPMEFAVTVREPHASFVTLRIGAQLRGCTGSVKVRRPLVVDVAENAFNAAFQDPRFTPLRAAEFPTLTIQVSVLSPMEPLPCTSEADLLEKMRLGMDGLEIEYGAYRGVLLPSVWEQLPDKQLFLQMLKMKAGIPPTFWSQRIDVYRFTTESFGRKVTPRPDHSLS
ncbi:MAG: AmmeMemoRadiSam system protein A [Planctomycetia bacterium]|nr:AmmeMemoRadiSam system protein A [Planctomycetia bacterium]